MRRKPGNSTRHRFDIEDDRKVLRAFEDVRDGAAPDRILFDKRLAARFRRRCKELGLDAPDGFAGRRLLNIRKNPSRYAKLGIALRPTTKSDPQPSIVPLYAHAIEFAMVRLKYLYGASIDDILLEPSLGAQFEALASAIAPTVKPMDLRLGALYLRKTRHVSKDELELFDLLNADAIETAMSTIGNLAEFSPQSLPAAAGLIELLERDRYLYVVANENVRELAGSFVAARCFEPLANHFWKPEAESIVLRVFMGDRFENTTVTKWQRKLITAHEPVFNWPVGAHAA